MNINIVMNAINKISGNIHSISISKERGQLKKEVPQALLIDNYGIQGDGHAGNWGRQITVLDYSSVQIINREHNLSLKPGDMAENILIEGADLSTLKVNDRIKIGYSAVLEITQIGKEDHPSVVSKTFGVSLLPSEGLFCKVVTGGLIRKNDNILVLSFNI